jgi:DNA-binding transcriptional LysR family regulator
MTEHVNGNLDIRLMRTLLILLTECSVSRTAELVGQAQPTVSLVLKKLREILDDPLLVRSGSGLVPTERGLEIRDAMRSILAQIDTHLAPAPEFNPATAERTFRIVAANCLGTALLPPLLGRMARVAPGVRVDVSPMPSYEDLLSQLADGTIDVVIGNWPNPPDHLRMSTLMTTDIVCLVRPSHRLAASRGRVSMADYLKEKHLSPTSEKRSYLSPIDGRLIELGLKRDISVSVPEYSIAPYVVAQSDVVFTTGRHFAEHIAQAFPFAVLDAPKELGQMTFYLLWHDCKHHSAAHVWLRHTIRAVSAEVRATDQPAIPQRLSSRMVVAR